MRRPSGNSDRIASGRPQLSAPKTNQSPGRKSIVEKTEEPFVVIANMRARSGDSLSRNASQESWTRMVAYS